MTELPIDFSLPSVRRLRAASGVNRLGVQCLLGLGAALVLGSCGGNKAAAPSGGDPAAPDANGSASVAATNNNASAAIAISEGNSNFIVDAVQRVGPAVVRIDRKSVV